ncbi:hypothetical protein HPB48_023511 [Haemaphysalis longicornis]|uniref:Amino acid transporter transmembrane domain-containing protein n=1 Tax=Haemaphysalis longicornis TaxID=44386 RepID=A0A9J6H6B0_HAELO|nr:hypothetical protein HPB48_023511 [Haemaphysalis longicornis]
MTVAGDASETADIISPLVGLAYIFNLIVGTGALTLPAAFVEAGWLLSLVVILVLGFMSYMTATFVIESMASANALARWKTRQRSKEKVANEDGARNIPQALQQEMRDELKANDVASKRVGEDGGTTLPASDAAERMTESPRTDYKRVAEGDERNIVQAKQDDTGNELKANDIASKSLGEDKKAHTMQSNAEGQMADPPPGDYFAITETFEMGQMAHLFFSKVGVNLFYIIIAMYLYGDLAIYGAAVSKSLRDAACQLPEVVRNNFTSSNASISVADLDDFPCWSNSSIRRSGAYRMLLFMFVLTVGPFTFFNVQKTKYLQILTTLMRWIAFASMIGLCTFALVRGKGQGQPGMIYVGGLPSLFGVCVYSFMCHHSLPSVVTPWRDKSRVYPLLAADYLLILAFYLVITLTAIFTFPELQDMYTLNFELKTSTDAIIPHIPALSYFLLLFPVFTLSTTFPIISITLRNNLHALSFHEAIRPDAESQPLRRLSSSSKAGQAAATPAPTYQRVIVDRFFYPLLALLPPVIVAMVTENVEFLVCFTGSYAGAIIQYVVPVALVHRARKHVAETLGRGVENQHASPFRHGAWLIFVLLWNGLCIALTTMNHVL